MEESELTPECEIPHILLALAVVTDGVVLTDSDGRVLWVNRGFERLCGYSLPELAGKKPGHLLQGGETDPVAVQRIRSAIRDARHCTEQLINYHKDGHLYRVSIHISPIRDSLGRVIRFFAIEREVHAHSPQGCMHSEADLIPVCAWCKAVRTDGEQWQSIETYLLNLTKKECTSAICPSCHTTFTANLEAL